MRTAVTQRHTKALGIAHGDVRAQFARGFQQAKRQQVGGHHHHRARFMRARDQLRVIRRRPVCGRVLQQDTEDGVIKFQIRRRRRAHLNAERFRARLQYSEVLRMTIRRRHKHITAAFAFHRMTHGHRLGAGGGFIE